MIAICDRVTVLRDGAVTLVAEAGEVTLAAIIEHMLGRSLESALAYEGARHRPDRRAAPAGQPASATAAWPTCRSSSAPGEILGIAGLLGSGRSELLRAIFGIDRLDAGSIEMAGRAVRLRSPKDALDAGIALIPEDRARAGLVRDHSVGHNILMAAWRRFARAGLIDDGAATGAARRLMDQLQIRATGLDQEVRSLSGGNQQKVVVAKNLTVDPSVLLLDDPTVGVDVGSKREILTEVRDLARNGKGIVLVSSEFEELSGVADRVLLLRDGAVAAGPGPGRRRRPLRRGALAGRPGLRPVPGNARDGGPSACRGRRPRSAARR